jgi:ATP-dependent Clp protease ATP-binding subunit ClpC
MWKQLTQKARKAIFLAQEEAGKLGYSHVAPEHLLLALIREDDCIASTLLVKLGLDLGTVRDRVMGNLSRGSEELSEGMQLTPEAKDAIDFAFDESRQMNEGWVGTEHMLIGIIRETESMASKILASMGTDTAGIRVQLRDLQAGTLPFDEMDGRSVVVVPKS